MRRWIPMFGAVIASLAMASAAQAQLQASYKTSVMKPNLRMKLTSRKVVIKRPMSARKPDLGFQHLGVVHHRPKVTKLTTARRPSVIKVRHQKKLNVSKISMQHASPKDEDE